MSAVIEIIGAEPVIEIIGDDSPPPIIEIISGGPPGPQGPPGESSALESLAWKDSVRVSTQDNINISAPGASVNGIAMTVGDRALVRAQTAPSENGIRIWNGAAASMPRAPDADTADELEAAVVPVEEGTDAGATYRQTSVNFALDTDPVNWTPFTALVPDATESVAGKAELATQGETNSGADDARIVTPAKLSNWTGRNVRDGRGEFLHLAALAGEANSARVTISTSDPPGALDDGEIWIKVEA